MLKPLPTARQARPVIYLVTFVLMLLLSTVVSANAEDVKPRFTLATTPQSSERFRSIDGQVTLERPGYLAETFLAAGERCNVDIAFKTAPWNRVLHLVEYGKVDAAFRASFNSERAIYGAYPRQNSGELDVERALSSHSYSLFVSEGADLIWDGDSITGEDRLVAVEAASIGLDIAQRLNLEPIEVKGYQKMVEMLSSGRVDAVLGITVKFQGYLDEEGITNEQVRRERPPVEEKASFLMFSKITYDQHSDPVECLWDEIADIMSTDDYRTLVESYQSE